MPLPLAFKVSRKPAIIVTFESSSHLTVTLVAGLVLLIGILTSVVLGSKSEPTITPHNDLRDFDAESLSRTKIMVWIRYRYIGDRGDNNVYISANALQNDGSQYPDTTSTIAPVRIGAGIASVEIRKHHGAGRGVSERVKVCLQEGTGRPFYCETFLYRKSWSYNLHNEPPSQNEIGGFAVLPIGSRGTLVGVDYAYTGDHGKDNIKMVAFALKRNRDQVPGTYPIPVKVRPGYGRAMLKIHKRPGYARAMRRQVEVMYDYS